MAMRKPKKSKIGGKFLVYGKTHEGKSWFGLTFPNIASVDSEAGLAFEEGQDIIINGKAYNNLIAIDDTNDLDSLEEYLDDLIEGDLQCETFLIDSETKFYNSMDITCTEIEERKAKLNGKNVDTRAKWGRIKNLSMKFQQAKITASAKGIHIVSTAQAVELVDDQGKHLGWKADVHKQLPFDYDVILRFFTQTDKKTGEKKYFAEVEKDRTHATKVGDIIENCTYDIWKPIFDKRAGLETLEADFSKDLKKSVNSALSQAEQSENLTKEIKQLIKKASKDKANTTKIKKKIDELDISVSSMETATPDVLKQLKNFIESL